MDYALKFRLFPDAYQRAQLDNMRDTVRQVYNHVLYRFNQIPESAGTVSERVTTVRDELPDLKDWWTELNNIYSTILQHAVEQIATNITNLGKLKQAGYQVGSLNWKSPRDFRSFTYRQRGFELDKKSGPSTRGTVILKKVAGETLEIPVQLHRCIPDEVELKHATIKKEKTGAWYVCFSVERETPDKPAPADIDPADTVGIDLGIVSFVHDSTGLSVSHPDLSVTQKRLKAEKRALSRKEHGSNNWEKQRQRVAELHKEMCNIKKDFKHKLAAYYTQEYDAVFVEDLNVTSMLEQDRTTRRIHEVGWRDFMTILKHHGRKRGCHVVEVRPENTTQKCTQCGVMTDKPLWVREHSCPSCGFELDRDLNAALNIWKRGLERVGVVRSESTPVETGTAVEREARADDVSARTVVEAGTSFCKERSPRLKEPAVAGE